MRETLTGPVERLDITGIEVGRFLILGAYFDSTLPRAFRYRVDVECSCSRTLTNIPLKDIMSGKRSRCVTCCRMFRAKYGTKAPSEKVTAREIYEAVAIRDTEHPQLADEAAQYNRARQALGL